MFSKALQFHTKQTCRAAGYHIFTLHQFPYRKAVSQYSDNPSIPRAVKPPEPYQSAAVNHPFSHTRARFQAPSVAHSAAGAVQLSITEHNTGQGTPPKKS